MTTLEATRTAAAVAAATLALSALPPVGQPLEGGTFVGVTTRADGTHCAVVLLDGHATDLTWTKAKAWARKQGGELPSRPVAALIFANVKKGLQPRWHWTTDTEGSSYAWTCDFRYGNQSSSDRGSEGCAVAVRMIPLTA